MMLVSNGPDELTINDKLVGSDFNLPTVRITPDERFPNICARMSADTEY